MLAELAKYYNIKLLKGVGTDRYDFTAYSILRLHEFLEANKNKTIRYYVLGRTYYLHVELDFKIGDIVKDSHGDMWRICSDIATNGFTKLKDNVWELIKDFPSGVRNDSYLVSIKAPSFDNKILKRLKKEFVNSVYYKFEDDIHRVYIDFTIPGFVDYHCMCNDIKFVVAGKRKMIPAARDLKKKITMRSADPTHEEISDFLSKNSNNATVYYHKDRNLHVITLVYEQC